VKAGTAQVCITPPVGIELSGYVDRQQPSIGVHDDLYARGLYLEQGEEKLLWLHCDLIGFVREWVCCLRKRLAAELELEERQIILSATHTHAGPATLPLRQCGRMNEVYLEELDRRLLNAARVAAADPEAVMLRYGEGQCTLGRDRRPPTIHSHIDERVPVLAFLRQDGGFLALVANYVVHNVALSYENRLISADMAGVAAELARQQLPGEPIVLMTNGGCANIQPLQVSPDPALMERQGQELGDVVARTAQAGQPCIVRGLVTAMETLELPLAAQSRDEVIREYENSWDRLSEDSPWRGAIREWRDETLALLERGAPSSVVTDLQALRIGPLSLVAIGAEVFSRMAEELRTAHGPHTYVVGYANGDLGYLPFREIYDEGGYEVDVAYKFYANFMIAPGAYEMLRDRAVELLRALKDPGDTRQNG
jgi:neutral ceramidase